MKLRLPIILATALLSLMSSHIQATPVIHYFQKASSEGSLCAASSGSDHWTIATQKTKFELYLPNIPTGVYKVSDLSSISFTTQQGAQNSIYGNLYLNIFTTPGSGTSQQGSWYDSRLNLETCYAKGFEQKVYDGWNTWTTDKKEGTPQLTICDTATGVLGYPGGATLDELISGPVKHHINQTETDTRDYSEETLKRIAINFNDSLNNTPGTLDLQKVNLTIQGQEYQWNFVAVDYLWEVNTTEALGLVNNLDMALTLKGGEGKAEIPLLVMEDVKKCITLNGGTTAIGEDATVKIDAISYNVPSKVALEGVLVEMVNNDQLGTGSGIMSFYAGKSTSHVSISQASFLDNNIVSDGHNSGFGNQLGSVLFFEGSGYSEDKKAYLTKLSVSNAIVRGNTTETTFADTENGNGGPQGTFYVNSAEAFFDHVEFSDNTLTATNSSALGGALCTWSANLIIENSKFEGNRAIGLNGAEGGALYYGDGRWGGSDSVAGIIRETSFINNSVESTASDDSVDIYSQGGAVKLKNVTNDNGVAFKAPLSLENVVFTGNTVKGKSHAENKGGAIYNVGTVLNITATRSMSYSANAVLLDGTAKDEQGGFLYLATNEGQPQGIANFDIAQGATLTIGEYGKTGYDSIAGTAGTQITKTGDGVLLVNSSMNYFSGDITLSAGALDVRSGLTATGKINISSGAALYTGFTIQKGETLSTTTGLGEATKITIAEGGKLGTHLYNDDLSNKWVITYKELAESTAKAFAPYTGDGFSGYTYLLRGGVTLTDSVINPGDTIDAGAGSNVDLGTSLPDNSVVISGGTVDASKVEGPLSDTQIKGSSGDLITSDKQEVIFTQSGESGFNIHGGIQNGNMIVGANLLIAKAADTAAEAPAVVLTGIYASNKVAVKEGSLEITGTSAVLGVAGGTVSVGNTDNPEATSSRLVNNATILSHVEISEGSLLKGAGTFLGNVALNQGANLYVGNSPGRMDIQGGTFSVNGNRLAFCLDGYEAATKTATGRGYYSNIHMQGGILDWNGDNTLVLDLGFGLLATDKADVSFTLISGDSETVTTGLSQEELDAITITQTGSLAGLLDETRLSWDSATQSMVLDATLNTALISTIVMEDGSRIANALWSSTRSVGNFAHVATSQLNAPRNGKSNVWVSGLGDFASVSGDANNGFDYNGGGYALGADYAFCKCFTGGLAFGQTFGTQKGDRGLSNIKQDGLMMALYGRSTITFNEKHSLDIDGYFTYGDVENKGDLSLLGGAASSHAKWHDDVFGGGLKASWNIKLDATSTLMPFVGIDYLRGEQDNLNLGYAGGSSNWYGGAMQTWTIPVGITYKKVYSVGGDQYLVPEITIAYTGDIARQDPSVKTSLFGKELKAKGTTPGRSAFLGNTGLRWIMDKNWSASAYYTIETRSDMTNQGVNASVNYTF